MRAVHLTIQNFGMFYDKTTVDFNKLGDGIYLISGPTGSGKTTIFDAMVYALYGMASGSGRTTLGTDSFYSDFGRRDSPRRPMTVEFTFTNNGTEYKVERILSWGATGNAAKTTRISELRENGTLIVRSDKAEKNDDVTRKIKEILGLDADQFSKIVMLAQGEFRKFLEADSEEREMILGKLFNNRAHKDLMNRLKAVTTKLISSEKTLSENAKNKIDGLALPENYPESEKEKLRINHPECLHSIETLINILEEEQRSVSEDKKRLNDAVTPLKENYARAEDDNKRIAELTKEKENLEKLQGQKAEYDALQEKVDAAKKAEKLLPKEKRAGEAAKRFSEAEENLKGLTDQQSRLQLEKEILGNNYERIEKNNRPVIQEKTNRKQQLEGILHQYDERALKKTALENAEASFAEAENECRKANQQIEQNTDRKNAWSKTLSELSDVNESSVQLAEKNRQDAANRVESLKKLSRELSDFEHVCDRSKSLTDEYEKRLQEKKEKDRISDELSRSFLTGQAGVLAHNLKETIQKEGQGICPVCGTVHTVADLEAFAALTVGIPSQDEVEEARRVADEADSTAQKAFEEASRVNNERDAKRKAILDFAATLLERSTPDDIFTTDLVEKACSEAEAALKNAELAKGQTEKRFQQKQEISEKLAKLNIQLMKDEEDRNKALSEREEKQRIRTQAEVEYQEKVKALASCPPEKKDADEEISQLTGEMEALEKQIQKVKEDLEECNKNLSEITGNIDASQKTLKQREEESKDAGKEFRDGLEEQFGSLEEYKTACAPEGILLKDNELSTWIVDGDKKIRHYQKQLSDSVSRVEAFEKSTTGKEYTDLADLETQISNYDSRIEELIEKDKEIYSRLETNRDAHRKLIEIRKELCKVQGALKTIKPMDDAANGQFSFSRYALLDSFKNVVDCANEHLEIMTDGEYILEQTDGESGKRKKGLGLCVYNAITDTRRDKQSLSGGQSFEASLALALGLSDVAQSRSTGMIQIDSMFIDEGFGSLDEERLNKAINVLNHVSGGYRQIGIISHIAGLDDLITKKLVVTSSDHGSYINYETDC